MKVIAEFSIIPIGVGTSFSKYIAECERILKKANLKVQLHAEGTNIEGDLNEVMEAIKRCLETLHDMEVPRLIT
ncbi:MAG: MTH1187 family thiamine-binding protein, partial [Candidatus Berkiellales bacterium]